MALASLWGWVGDVPAVRTRPRGEVVKFKPVSVEGDDVAAALTKIARGVNDLHTCVHSGHEAQAERDRIADQKREALAEQVGAIQLKQDVDSGRITALAKAIGTERVEKGEPRPKAHVDVSWKAMGKVALTVFGAFGGIVLFLQIIAPGITATWEAIMKANP